MALICHFTSPRVWGLKVPEISICLLSQSFSAAWLQLVIMERNRLNGKGAIWPFWEDVYHCLGLRRSTAGWSCAHQHTGWAKRACLGASFKGSESCTRTSGDCHCSSFWSATHTRACFSPIAVGSVVVTIILSVDSTCSTVTINIFFLFWPYPLCWCAVWVCYQHASVTQETGQNFTALKTNWILMLKKTSLLCCKNIWLPSSSRVEPARHEYFIPTYVRVQWRLISSCYTASALHVQGRPVCLSCHLLFRKSVFPGIIQIMCTQLAAHFYLDVVVLVFFRLIFHFCQFEDFWCSTW